MSHTDSRLIAVIAKSFTVDKLDFIVTGIIPGYIAEHHVNNAGVSS